MVGYMYVCYLLTAIYEVAVRMLGRNAHAQLRSYLKTLASLQSCSYIDIAVFCGLNVHYLFIAQHPLD